MAMASENIMMGWIERNQRFTIQKAKEKGIPDEDVNRFVVQWLIPPCIMTNETFPEYGEHVSKKVLLRILKDQITDLTEERLDTILQSANGKDILLEEEGTIILKNRPSTGHQYKTIDN